MLFHAQVGEIAAIAREELRLGQRRRRSALVFVAEEELACLHRRSRTRRRLLAGSGDDGLREAVTVAKMLARDAVERREGFEVQRREDVDSGERRQVLAMLSFAAVAFLGVAGEQNHNRVKRRAREIADPSIGAAVAGDAENLRSGGHPLAELPGKGIQRLRGHAERFQALEGERHAHPRVGGGTFRMRGRRHHRGGSANQLAARAPVVDAEQHVRRRIRRRPGPQHAALDRMHAFETHRQ